MLLPLVIFIVLVLILDLYTYKGLKLTFRKPQDKSTIVLLNSIFWAIPLLLILSVVFMLYLRPAEPDPCIFNLNFYIIGFTLVFYLPKLLFSLFHLIEDIVFLVRDLSQHVITFLKKDPNGEFTKRRSGMNYLSRTGILLSFIPFVAILHGVFIGRFDFQVINKHIEFKSLPASFDGFRIVHISDFHIGSFCRYTNRVEKAVKIINKQKPDMIVITGDIVNNFTAELYEFTDILSELYAPYGVYSILGNHDYGDYFQWESNEAKEKNLDDMLVVQEEMGFRLLLNEWDSVVINGEKIAVIGVENWGLPPFPQYGDLAKAMEGAENVPFRILLSHDPTHWDAEVLGRTSIELTLSGHTHGMQVGIENSFLKWSPSKFKYPRWGGLYREEEQYLYVNRGLGFVAFPGRIGMPPEITVIELRSGS